MASLATLPSLVVKAPRPTNYINFYFKKKAKKNATKSLKEKNNNNNNYINFY